MQLYHIRRYLRLFDSKNKLKVIQLNEIKTYYMYRRTYMKTSLGHGVVYKVWFFKAIKVT
jgi:hypothetical protein